MVGAAKIGGGAQEIRRSWADDPRQNEVLHSAGQSLPARLGAEGAVAGDSRTPERVSPDCAFDGEVHVCTCGYSPEQSIANESRAVGFDRLGAGRPELKLRPESAEKN